MSESKNATVEKGQVYLSNEDRRYGIVRTVTVERTVRARRVYDKTKQEYAVGVSRVDAHEHRPDLVGKKRRVFLKVSRVLSSEYSLVTTLEVAPIPPHDIARDAACERHEPEVAK